MSNLWDAPLVISSSNECLRQLRPEVAGRQRTIFDRHAFDTLSNFTRTLHYWGQFGSKHILVITSVEHLPRASWVGRIVLVTTGLGVTFVAAPCVRDRTSSWTPPPPEPESILRLLRDVGRACVYVMFGLEGRCVALWRHPERRQYLKQCEKPCCIKGQ